MIALSRAMLAAPLMAVAVAASSPVGSFSALLAPFQPQGSGLHARQVLVPSECFSICDPVITSVNVSNTSPLTKNSLAQAESPRPEFPGLQIFSMRMHDSAHEWARQLHGVHRHGDAVA
jgi:hypothetical protein